MSVKKTSHKSSAGLHALYVKTACRHITLVNEMVGILESEVNSHALEIAETLRVALEVKCRDNEAYADALEILEEIEKARGRFNKPATD